MANVTEVIFFTISKRIKITIEIGIIPGQLWKPFELMNKDGRKLKYIFIFKYKASSGWPD
jgi:hypothetical protein